MKRLVAPLFTIAIAVLTNAANAQFHGGHGHHHDIDSIHGHHIEHFRPLDVRQLDEDADLLAQIASHLHEDAHELSQDYHHSGTIEAYVDQLDQLQQHMHEVLHEAAESGHQSTALAIHMRRDVARAKQLMRDLYGELQHQRFDGARPDDFRYMAHMQEILEQQAYPLATRMERALRGSYRHHPGW